ncbi:histidine phosphatase family protein [Streptomyces sp. NPDC006512]|uniref:SixA phosphatase family protein n=1 Tax=Streptomyces sp. NPDC006512 TaxID=3154307 RepID=UPI0033ACDCC1
MNPETPPPAASSVPVSEEGRRLLLVRHAKAVPKGLTADFDRPLSDRGRRDAPAAGRWLAASGFTADLALCSPARRTRQTWELILPALTDPPPTVYDDRLYDATPSGLADVLSARGGRLGSILLVGHNSGIHELASALCGDGPAELLERLRAGLPTSGVVAVDLPGGWDGLTPHHGRLTAFWSPADA